MLNTKMVQINAGSKIKARGATSTQGVVQDYNSVICRTRLPYCLELQLSRIHAWSCSVAQLITMLPPVYSIHSFKRYHLLSTEAF